GDREVAPIGRERARGVDEAQALVVARDCRFYQAPQDLTRLRVGEIEVDEERVLLAEVRNLAPVRGEGRREVQRAVRALRGESRLRDPPGAVVVGELREI